QSPVVLFVVVLSVGDYGAHGMEYFGKGLHHMFGLFDLVFGVADIELENRDTVFIYDTAGVDLAKILIPGDGFTAAGHVYGGAEERAIVFLQGFAIAACFFFDTHDLGVAIDLFDTP